MMANLKKVKSGLYYIGRRFFADGCSYLAASLAYSTLLSLVPLLLLSFWVLSFFPAFAHPGELFKQFVINNFVASSANVILQYIDIFLRQGQITAWYNILSLALIAILLMYNLVWSFNVIWHVQFTTNLVRSFLIYLIIAVFAPLIFASLILLSLYLSSFPLIYIHKLFLDIKPLIRFSLPLIAEFCTFTLMNWFLPSCKVRFSFAMLSGLITTLLFEFAKHLFGLYLKYTNYQNVYGALATVPIFLIWMYIAWSIVLIGAIICHAFHEQSQKN